MKCVSNDGSHVAIKIIKNKPAYYNQGLVEVKILSTLNSNYNKRIVKMMDYFVYRKHLVIVFELLNINLYEILKQNSFRGLPFNMFRSIADQLVKELIILKINNVIHCDMKPENILLCSKKNEGVLVRSRGFLSNQGNST